MALFDIFSKSPQEEAREAEAQAEFARRQEARRNQQDQVDRQRAQAQRDAENLFASMGRADTATPTHDLARPQCLEILRPPQVGGYIGDLKVHNLCDEPITYSYCYRGTGRKNWKLFECKADAQGHYNKGSNDLSPGQTVALPESLSSTRVDLVACRKGAVPLITSVDSDQAGTVCR